MNKFIDTLKSHIQNVMGEVKLFYDKNKAISKWGIVASVISLSYAITNYMPDYLGIEPYYALANNICISYIAAVIFFIVQVYIPEGRNRKKCMEILKANFVDITKFVELVILVCEKHIKINEKGATIEWNGEGECIYVKLIKSGNKESSHVEKYTKSELFGLKDTFDNKMRKIKETTVISYCDYEILEKISELEKNNMFHNINNVIIYANSDISFSDFKNTLNNMREINKSLKKMCGITDIYELDEVDGTEQKRIDILMKNIHAGTVNIDKINREILREAEKK